MKSTRVRFEPLPLLRGGNAQTLAAALALRAEVFADAARLRDAS